MLANTLFNLLLDPETNTSGLTTLGAHIVPTKDLKSNDYYRIDLTSREPTILSHGELTYTLQNEHLSIYRKEDSHIPELSQYHYTAYFKDNLGASYQLHVYFDEKDRLTTAPKFSIATSAGSFTNVSAEPLEREFIHLAIEKSQPLVAILRQQMEIMIQKRETEYKKLEREASALSALDHHDEAHIAKLEAASVVLLKLTPLVFHDHYQSYYHFIQLMITALKARIEDHGAPEASTAAAASPPLREQPEVESERAAAPPMALESRAKDAPEHIDNRIVALIANFAALPRESDLSFAKELVKVMDTLRQISALLEDSKGFTASMPSLKGLQQLHSKVYQAGEQLFSRAMISANTELLTVLVPFHYLLSIRSLTMALQTGNSALLEFILNKGQFVLNAQPIAVRDRLHPSAIHLCVELSQSKAGMTECLATLIQHDASLLVADERGIPIAHTLLSHREHPLHGVFTLPEVKDKTLHSTSFFKQLLAAMQRYLAIIPGSEVTLQDEIKASIELYRRQSLSGASLTSDFGLRRTMTSMSEGEFATRFADQVQHDRDLRPYFLEIDRLHTQLKRYVKPTQARNQSLLANSYLENINAFINKISKSLTYEQVKENALLYLKDAVQVLAEQIEYYKIRAELPTSPVTHVSRKNRQRLTRARELELSFQAYNEKYLSGSGQAPIYLTPPEDRPEDESGDNNLLETMEALSCAGDSFSSLSSALNHLHRIMERDLALLGDDAAGRDAVASRGEALKPRF